MGEPAEKLPRHGVAPPDCAGTLSFRSAAMVFFFSLSLLLVNPSGLVLTRHEVLAAQPAREMLAGESWIIPQFAGVPRVNKPPTMSWLIAASLWGFGTESEWAARLPANVAGAILCVLTAAIAARLLGDPGGLVAGLVTATSYYLLVQARLSEADIPMAACIAASYYAFIRATVGPAGQCPIRSRAFWSVLFYAAAGMSVLFKGVGIAFILPACVAWTILHRDRRAARVLMHPAGLLALLAVLLPWPMAAVRAHPPILEAWHREMFQRVSGQLGEQLGRQDPWYEYFLIIPMMLLPWIVFGIPAVAAGLRRGTYRQAIVALLVCWFVIGLVILTMSAWKNRHYSIPILPPAGIASAAGILLWTSSFARWAASTGGRPARAVAAVLCLPVLAAAGIAFILGIPFSEEALALGVILALGIAATLELLARQREWAGIAAMFVTAWLLIAVVFWRVVPATDLHRAMADFARRVDAATPPGSAIYLVDLGEHQSAYYLRHRLVRIDRLAEVPARLPAGDSELVVLAPASARATLERVGSVSVRDEVEKLPRRQPPAQRLTCFLVRPRP